MTGCLRSKTVLSQLMNCCVRSASLVHGHHTGRDLQGGQSSRLQTGGIVSNQSINLDLPVLKNEQKSHFTNITVLLLLYDATHRD